MKKGSFHPGGSKGIKADILRDLRNSDYSKQLEKMGKNPDIYLADDGTIQIVSTQYKGKSFATDWNINSYAP